MVDTAVDDHVASAMRAVRADLAANREINVAEVEALAAQAADLQVRGASENAAEQDAVVAAARLGAEHGDLERGGRVAAQEFVEQPRRARPRPRPVIAEPAEVKKPVEPRVYF